MKRPVVKTIVLAISIVFVVTLIYGCKEQIPEDTKLLLRKSRLIATENTQLKKELATSQETIEKLKGQIEEYQVRTKKLEEAIRENSAELVETAFKGLSEDTFELTAENMALKAEIEELKKELESLKQPHP